MKAICGLAMVGVFVLALLLVSFLLGAMVYIVLQPYSLGHWWLCYKICLLSTFVINTTALLCPIIYTAITKKKV